MINKVFGLFILSALLLSNAVKADIFFVEQELAFQIPDKKFNALKQEVFFYLNGSWCSETKANLLMDLIVQTKPNVCVEIGAFSGSCVLPVAATLKFLEKGKVYAVDAWSNSDAINGLDPNDKNTIWWSQVPMEKMKAKFDETIMKWILAEYCTTLHMTSEQAVDYFQTIDFLHLDGNFSEEISLKDAELYLPKVRSGGFILLSNLFNVVGDKLTKMKTLWRLMDECEVVFEIENSNVVLFRKL